MKNILSFFKDKITIQYRENKTVVNYVLDIVFNVSLYALLIVALVAVVTFIGFGYAPIDVFENPKATLDYIWPYGIIVLTVPLALFFIIPNLINLFKNKHLIFLISSLIFFILLVFLNLLIYQLDLMTIIASWFDI